MKTVIDPDYRKMLPEVEQLPRRMQAGEGELIYEGRNRVVRFTVAGKPMVVKQFKRPNLLQRIVYTFFRPSKAKRAYLYGSEIWRRGFAVPHRVAYMEQRRWGLFATGYFVCLFEQGTETHLLLREVQDFSHELADAVAHLVVELHKRGVLHGDLNLSNLLCFDCDWDYNGYRFWIIDNNRTRFTDGFPSRRRCLKNMVRLTHRRDLYEYLVRSYARQRQWDEDATAAEALRLLDRFESRRFKL